MTSTPDDQVIVQIKHRFNPATTPEGWTVTPIRWNGRDLEIGVDPRYDAIRITPTTAATSTDIRADGSVITSSSTPTNADTAAELLERDGWRHKATDDTGQQLWIRDRAAAAVAQLDHLAATVPPPALSVA